MPALGEIALSETIRRVTEQGGTLNQIRTSAGAVVSATTVGTAFLAGIALRDVDGLPLLGWLALIAVVASTFLALYTLGPAELGVGVNPETLADPAWQQLDDGTASFELAKRIAKQAAHGKSVLDKRWRILQAASVSSALSIVLWIALIATR